MKIFFTTLFLAISVSIYAQTEETPKDSLNTLKQLNEELEKRSINSNPNSGKSFMGEIDKERILNIQPESSQEIEPLKSEMTIPFQPIYKGPPLEYTNTSFPLANDYAYYGGVLFTDNLWLSTVSSHNTYSGIGANRMASAHLNYMPADWMIISAGPYASKQNLFANRFNDFGVSGQMKLIVHERIRFNVYGQYSINAFNNGIADDMTGMYQQTYYGGSLEFKITDKFGIEGGVIRELNPFTGKWQNVPYIAPVFYNSKK